MKRIHFFLALSILSLFVSSSFGQVRGQGRVSVPSNPALSGSSNPGNLGSANPGKGSADIGRANQATNAPDAGNARDTEGFKNYGLYVAAQHVSQNLGIPFDQLKAKMTGPNAESLGKAIQDLTGLSATAANAEAKKAEQAAKNETKKH